MSYPEGLDAELAEALASVPAMDLSDLSKARQRITDSLPARDEALTGTIRQTDHIVPGANGQPQVLLREYRPLGIGGRLPCLLWMHGGGHVMGTIDQDDEKMSELAAAVGCVAMSVDWRLAPEYPYPAALLDCHAGLKWINENAAGLQIDSGRIAIGGRSSGGGLAAGLALYARDRAEYALPSFQLLLYPMLDDRTPFIAGRTVGDRRLWHDEANTTAWRCYLGDAFGTDSVETYAAPSRAADLSGLPPAYIAVGTLDLFFEENVAYATALARSNPATELHAYPGAYHGFDTRVPQAEVSLRFVRDRDEALRAAFAG
jgi:acetyl esterase/lipase